METKNGKWSFVPDFDENGNYQYTDEIRPRSLDTTALLAHLVKAFQEQVQTINELRNRIEVLEGVQKNKEYF